MSTYSYNTEIMSDENPSFMDWLGKLHSQGKHPFCMCQSQPIEMYIAKIGNNYVIKRMPNSGKLHHVNCASYEPPIELSGYSQVEGSAIQENPGEGTTALRLDFSLTKNSGKAMPESSGLQTDTVKTDGTKLTLKSTLDFLWEQAGFNRFTPAMKGKRNWYIIRKYLNLAAGDKFAKKQNLRSLLYIPQSFSVEKKDELKLQRNEIFNKIAAGDSGARKLMIMVGEVKSFEEARFGYKIVFKHLPDCPFMINEDLYKRIFKRFCDQIEIWNLEEKSHLILIGTFGVSRNGIPNFEEVSMMNVSEEWIPFENINEHDLISNLVNNDRSFIKGMRYNLRPGKAMASAVLSDTGALPTALYIVNAEDEILHKETNELIENSHIPSWIWDINSTMPSLPEKALVNHKDI